MNRDRPQSTGGYSTPRGGRSSRTTGHRNPHMNVGDGSLSDNTRGGRSHGRRQFSPASYPWRSYYTPTIPVREWVKKPSAQLHQDQTASNATTTRPKQSECSHSAPETEVKADSDSSCPQGTPIVKGDDGDAAVTPLQDVFLQPLQSGAKDQSLQEEQFSKRNDCTKDSGISENLQVNDEPFDICLPNFGPLVSLKPTLFDRNRGKRNEVKRALEGQGKILEPGMVLLKGYLSIDDQVRIVNKCRNLGLGSGGFYQPGYHDGAKLHLKMMCLGRNWDPNTSTYGDLRSIDEAEPPIIPVEFRKLVDKAMKDSSALLEKNTKASGENDVLPEMSPDICIVNFYSLSGRLGLHQDKDESEGSLRKGLPVVSFSIGDTGEFLYGDNRDEKDAKKVLLESGDVLIFGGKSRHIFHGVPSVQKDTAPKSLLDESHLRAGRLNLTFRQY